MVSSSQTSVSVKFHMVPLGIASIPAFVGAALADIPDVMPHGVLSPTGPLADHVPGLWLVLARPFHAVKASRL